METVRRCHHTVRTIDPNSHVSDVDFQTNSVEDQLSVLTASEI